MAKESFFFTGGRSIIAVDSNKPSISFTKKIEQIDGLKNEYYEIIVNAIISKTDFVNVFGVANDFTTTPDIDKVSNVIITEADKTTDATGFDNFKLAVNNFKLNINYDKPVKKADFNVTFTTEDEVIKTNHAGKTSHAILPPTEQSNN